MDKYVLYYSKKKLRMLFLLGTVIVLISLFVLYIGLNKQSLFDIVVVSFGSLFFGMCYVYIIKRLLKPEPILIIKEDGIVDNSTGVSVGFIPWKYIEGFEVEKHFTTNYIAVKVSDNNEIIAGLSIFKKSILKLNIMLKASGVLIDITNSQEHYTEVLDVLNKYYELYK